MLVLLLSPVPMVRGFGVLLVVGVAIALPCALTAGAAAMALRRRAARARRQPLAGRSARIARRVARRARAAARERADAGCCPGPRSWRAVRRPGARAVRRAWRSPRSAGGSTRRRRVETDITKLVPQNLGSLQALNALERTTGVGGEIDLMVTGANLTSPRRSNG